MDGREGSVVIGDDSDGSVPDGFNVTITGDVTDSNKDDSVDVTDGSVKLTISFSLLNFSAFIKLSWKLYLSPGLAHNFFVVYPPKCANHN